MTVDDHVVPDSACTACGKVLDRAMTEGGRGPGPGDFTICLTCGHLMVFGDDMALRDPTRDEMREMAGDPTILRYQRVRGEVFNEKEKGR